MGKKKKLDLLLINPPNNLESVLGRGKHLVTATAPLGVLSIAAVVERSGFSVEFIDTFALGLSVGQVVEEIKQRRPLLVGITCLTAQATITVKLCELLRKEAPDVKIILGNLHAQIYNEYFLEHNLADFICEGEGEFLTLDVLRCLKEGGAWSDILGLHWRNDQGIVTHNAVRPVIPDLNELPFPARHLAPMHLYKAPFYFHNRRRCECLITSRGCPNRCAFCCVHGSRRPRYRRAELMVEEFNIIANQYGYDLVSFQDSLFVGNRDRIYEFCDILVKGGAKTPWGCEGHVRFVNPKLLKAMKAAGCLLVAYGIETGVERLLQSVNKHQTLEQIRQAIAYTKEAGIMAYGLFMLGLPTETVEDTKKTIKFAKSLDLDFAQFSIFSPYPGSQIYYDLVAGGRIDPMSWDQFSAYPGFGNVEQIYSPDGRTIKEMKDWQRRAVWDFYFRPRQIMRELRKIRLDNLAEALHAGWLVLRMNK